MNEETDKKPVKDFTVKKLIYYILSLLEILLAFRFVFKLLGANPGNVIVSYVYSISQKLLTPFTTIFRTAVTTGIETKSVFEPGTIIAMVFYALIAWGIVKIITVLNGRN